MKRVLSSSALCLLVISSVSCGKKSITDSGLKEIASSANETLLKEIKSKGELNLTDVLAKHDAYGLSDQEISKLKSNFSASEIPKLVLSFVDPNHLEGKVQPRWAYIKNVSDDDATLKKIEAVDQEGRIDVIDGSKSPESVHFPLITLSYSEKLNAPSSSNFKLIESDRMNLADDFDGSLMLEQVRLSETHEPWIKGPAEVYMVITYIGKDSVGKSELIELPSVDYANTDYDVRLIAHVWNKNHYQIVNISFFEHDSGHDYSTLVKAFITAAAGVATSVIDPTQVTTLAVATVVHTLADAVVDALPKGTLTDDDDFIDSVNTVEKFKNEQRNGAGGKSKVKFSHYNIMINHEGDASSDIGSSGYPYCPSEKFGNEFDCKGKRCAKSDPKFEKICEIK